MSYTPDPSMLLDPSLGLPTSGLAQPSPMQPPVQPPIGAVPGQPPSVNDPMVGMFLNSMQGGPSMQTPQGPPGTQPPGGPAQPGSAGATPTKPIATGNPAAQDHQPGVLKRMLMNFVYTGGETLKHSLGMPTDAEIEAGDQKAQLQQAQLEVAKTRAEAEKTKQDAYAQSQDLIDVAPTLRALGQNIPDGATVMVPRRQAGAEIKQRMANMPREQANQINAAKLGYTPNKDGTLTPLPEAQLSDQQRSAIDLNNANVELKRAQASLATDPNNPINKVKLQVAMQKMQQADERLRIQEHNSRRGDAALAFRMGQANMGDPNDPHNQYAQVTPQAQKILQSTGPVKNQIVDLLNRIDSLGLSENNQPGYLLGHRIKYSMGMGSPEGELGADISNLSLASVVGAARILQGSSRAYPALKKAMEHTPNTWTGSPKQMKQQLEFMLKNVDDVEQDAVRYGRKGGMVPVPQTGRTPRPGSKIRTAGGW
jgi:hypothetical protein